MWLKMNTQIVNLYLPIVILLRVYHILSEQWQWIQDAGKIMERLNFAPHPFG